LALDEALLDQGRAQPIQQRDVTDQSVIERLNLCRRPPPLTEALRSSTATLRKGQWLAVLNWPLAPPLSSPSRPT